MNVAGDPVGGGLALEGANPGAVERVEPGTEGAVQDRRLGTVELDHQIVEVERHDRGEQVLHRVDGGVAPADGGAPLGGLDFGDPGGHLGTRGEIAAPEATPCSAVPGCSDTRVVAPVCSPTPESSATRSMVRLGIAAPGSHQLFQLIGDPANR